MRNKHLKYLVFILIWGAYFAIRFPLLKLQNAYLDYDEGTYLMFARLIQEGFLPYRDIFAVHPPLYYYALAGWTWVFGNSYVIGRLFSVVLGLLSIVVAYYVGKELGGEKLGVAFAFLIALDPMAVKLNTLVLHGSMIELFTLLSLWSLIKYLKTARTNYAYYSLIAASIGSTAKFTIIPFLVALYVLLLFINSRELRRYLFGITNTILTSRQGAVVLVAYLLWSSIVVTIGVLVPTSIVRIIAIVPGIHSITKLGHVYSSVLFLFFWLGLTLYLFKLKYVHHIPPFLKALIKSIKTAVIMASIVIVFKAVIEVPLGLFVSSDYIRQTYLEQSGRGFPFVGIFWFMNKVLTTLQSDKPDNAIYVLPAMLLTATLLIIRQFESSISFYKEIKALLFLNILFYLIIIPIIPNVRMIYSLFIVLYLLELYSLLSGTLDRKRLGALGLTFLILLCANGGVVLNYPTGKLAISATPHIKEIRDDLGEYISSNNLNGTYLSINPMDTYYLNLKSAPYLVDTFGLGYLRGENITALIETFSPRYIVIDTWMFEIMKRAKVLFNVYNPVLEYVIANGTLLFAESTPNGECVELFELSPGTSWALILRRGTIEIYYNSTEVFSISPNVRGSYFLQLKNLGHGKYSVTIKNGTAFSTGSLYFNQTSLTLNVPGIVWNISFNGITLKDGNPITEGNVSSVGICTPTKCFDILGELEIEKGTVLAHNEIEVRVQKSSS
ncbi:glycosyltransferase family 39 protein [Thermococcus sp.]|uniref:ArnT family glycosyltransferase n=1 Tax=Thermococcus sp. TaxID=35749 RepID=UPI002619354A|nr:glycosyltransferase family 39 protein [Thermococcus sp.]